MTARNTRIRFAANNLAADTASTVTSSSALAGFPLTNLTNDQRFKVWKPTGRFVLSTSMNLYINDGSNKTVTLSANSFDTGTLLAAYLQTQLNASSSNWVVTYSLTTYFFSFHRSSGTGIVRLTQASALWDIIGYTDTSADLTVSSLTSLSNEARIHTSETVTVDLGVAQAVTFFALLGPLGDVFSPSSSATMTLKGNTTSSFTSPAITVTLTSDVNGIYQYMDDLSNTTYRFWRFEIIDRTNPLGPSGFGFGHMYLGDYTTITHRNVASGFNKTMVDPSVELESEGGARFFQAGLPYMEYNSVSIAFLDATDRRTLETLFYSLGRKTPFYVSFDPTQVVTTALSELTSYVLFKEPPVFNHVRADYYSVYMSFREVM